MIQIQKIKQPDVVGVAASTLCALHCMATPLLFLANAHAATHHNEVPSWWQPIDYIFIAISFLAIYASTRNSNIYWTRVALWGTWVVLTLAIVNETFEIATMSELFVYVPAFVLVALHLFNQRFGKCTCDDCCSN